MCSVFRQKRNDSFEIPQSCHVYSVFRQKRNDSFNIPQSCRVYSVFRLNRNDSFVSDITTAANISTNPAMILAFSSSLPIAAEKITPNTDSSDSSSDAVDGSVYF